MSIQPTDIPDYCWPIPEEVCSDEWESYSTATQQRAASFAVQTLRALTGYQVGGCPVTIRPCREQAQAGYPAYAYGQFLPVNWSGTWTNMVCGHGSICGCSQIQEIRLPLPVGQIVEVLLDGDALDPAAYRLDEPNRLVRLDGETWPACQDMAAALTEVGTFGVTYLNSEPVDGIGMYVAGLLAAEFAKGCDGKACALPRSVTQIVRQGVTMTIAPGLFPDGLTGIREVDAYTAAYNPNRLTSPPAVWSPDQPQHRITR